MVNAGVTYVFGEMRDTPTLRSRRSQIILSPRCIGVGPPHDRAFSCSRSDSGGARQLRPIAGPYQQFLSCCIQPAAGLAADFSEKRHRGVAKTDSLPHSGATGQAWLPVIEKRHRGEPVTTGSLPHGASVGVASFYTEGARTANGERLNPNALTAAHPSLPFGTRLRITSVASGRSVIVRVNDPAPLSKGGR